jgi:hypothetical protein
MLDMGRGARATSIKPLSTLIPHVMCQIYNGMNILILQNKSLIIIQLKQETLFNQILIHEKMEKLADIYSFYVNNQMLSKNKILSKGNHFIHFKGSLKGGMEPVRIFVYLSTSDQNLKEIPVESPEDGKYFEHDIKRYIEGFIMGSFNIRRIACPTNTRFIPTEEEGLDHIRKIIEKPITEQRRLIKE